MRRPANPRHTWSIRITRQNQISRLITHLSLDIRVILAHIFGPICGDDHPYITRYARQAAAEMAVRCPRRSGRYARGWPHRRVRSALRDLPGAAGRASARRPGGSLFPGFYVGSLVRAAEALARAGAPMLTGHQQMPRGCRVVAEDPGRGAGRSGAVPGPRGQVKDGRPHCGPSRSPGCNVSWVEIMMVRERRRRASSCR